MRFTPVFLFVKLTWSLINPGKMKDTFLCNTFPTYDCDFGSPAIHDLNVKRQLFFFFTLFTARIPNSFNHLKILSNLGQAGVLTGFKGFFGTFEMVRLADQLADCLSQLNTSLARL